MKVKIVITDAAGVLIEEGDAGPDALKVNLWGYKATAANPTLTGTKIRAIAYDRPGNTGSAERSYYSLAREGPFSISNHIYLLF